MTKLFVTALPKQGSKNMVYHFGDVSFVVSLDRSLKAADAYSFFLYDIQLRLIDSTETGKEQVTRSGRSLRVLMHESSVWLPGRYFLLMRSQNDHVWRFNLRLDEQGRFHADKPLSCLPMSDDDMLSELLPHHAATWKNLSRRPGLRQLKQWAIKRAQANTLNLWRQIAEAKPIGFCNNLIIISRDGTNMQAAAMMMKTVGEIPGELTPIDCSQLYDNTNANPYEKLHDKLNSNSSAKLSSMVPRIFDIYHIEALTDNGGRTLMKHLFNHWPDSGNAAIFTGTQAEVSALLEQQPTLGDLIPESNRLAEEAYTCEELTHLLFRELANANLEATAEASEKLCRLVKEGWQQGAIANWTWADVRHYVDRQLLPAYTSNMVRRFQQQGYCGYPYHLLHADDIDDRLLLQHNNSFDEARQDLNRMVGLDNIKASLVTLSNRMRFYAERRQLGLPTKDGAAFHAIFTGNPGTGKTTVARLLGRIYHSLGLLSRGNVISVDRSKMIGRYIGETEENMKAILHEAQGNVLFVDEAYTLYNKNDEKDFGRHALEALLDVLARHNPDMLIIFAGYEKEMDQLMEMNPGLRGRFPYTFRFTDYTAEQLMEIARRVLLTQQYVLSNEAEERLRHCLDNTVAARHPHFANARWVEQFVNNGIVPAMADRVAAAHSTMSRESYQRIEADDVQTAFERFSPKTIDLRQHRAIGFCA